MHGFGHVSRFNGVAMAVKIMVRVQGGLVPAGSAMAYNLNSDEQVWLAGIGPIWPVLVGKGQFALGCRWLRFRGQDDLCLVRGAKRRLFSELEPSAGIAVSQTNELDGYQLLHD